MEKYDAKFDPWAAKPPEVPKLPKPLSAKDFEEESKSYLASLGNIYLLMRRSTL